MSTPTGNNKKTAYVRKEEPGFLENLGVKYYRHLGKKSGFGRFLPPVDDAVPNILARAALEVPDPVIHYLGIDPFKHLSRSKLFLVAAFYNAKVILSSMAVKYVLIRFAGKGEARAAFSWVAIPITGLWDAFTLYKVAHEARLRLFGHKLAEHIVTDILNDEMIQLHAAKELCTLDFNPG